jgi:hypothetical protein
MSCGKQRKKFSFCEQQKMDWNVISSAINDVFSIIRDPSLIDIIMLLPGVCHMTFTDIFWHELCVHKFIKIYIHNYIYLID